MKTREAIVKRIFEINQSDNNSFNSIANKVGLAPSTLKNIINGTSKNPGIVTIKNVCDGLNVSLKEFFNSDIFEDLEDEDL